MLHDGYFHPCIILFAPSHEWMIWYYCKVSIGPNHSMIYSEAIWRVWLLGHQSQHGKTYQLNISKQWLNISKDITVKYI